MKTAHSSGPVRCIRSASAHALPSTAAAGCIRDGWRAGRILHRSSFALRLFLVLAGFASAVRGQEVVSNLTQTTISSSDPIDGAGVIGSHAFTTGPVAVRLKRVDVRLSQRSVGSARVKIWSGAGNQPVTVIEDLGGVNVGASGETTYFMNSAAFPVLAANTRYWVSVHWVSGDLNWHLTTSTTFTGSGTLLANQAYSLDSGASWVPGTPADRHKFAVLATPAFVVTNTNDSGAGSLRQALIDAANTVGPDDITFDPSLSGKTLNLTTAPFGSLPFKRAIEISDATGSVTVDATALPGGIIISDGTATDYSLFRVNAGSTVAFHGVTFYNGGGASVARGGAIQNYGSLTCTRCSFVGNQANRNGGNPEGSNGGAIYSENGTLALTHCTFSGNQAIGDTDSGNGGAIRADGGTLALTHCTLSGNAARNVGGGLLLAGCTLTASHTIIGGNTTTVSSATADVQNSGSIVFVGKNIVPFLATVGGGTAPTGPTPLIDAPQLAGLAFYGGSTPTLPPLIGSPALDPVGGDTTSPFTTDQRGTGYPRVVDGDANPGAILDIGAVEREPAPLSPVVMNTNDSGPGSLRDTLAAVPSGSTITFAPALSGQTIALSTFSNPGGLGDTALPVKAATTVTLDASSLPGGVTISGGSQNFRLFYVPNGSSLTLIGLTLKDGGGSDFLSGGGAILNDGTLTLTHCTLSGNGNSTPIGGAILNDGTLTLTHCTLSGNQASLGGGIYNRGTLTVNQSALSGNQASSGGGIFSSTSSNLTTTSTRLTHCTVTGNTASNGGGGISNNNGRTTLTQCTVSGNTAPAGQGSGVASFGDTATETVVVNSIIAANNGSSVDLVNGATNSFTPQGRNLIGSGNATGDFTANGDLINNAPQLAPLASNGGLTQTMALLAGSPAIDAATGSTSTTDQRGFSLQDGDGNGSVLADIGAAEAQVTLVTTATDEDNGTTNPATGTGTSLREAIADTSGHADIIRFDPAVFDGQSADVIRLTVDNSAAFNKQLTIDRSLSVDARNLPTSVTISGDSDNSGTPNSVDTRIFGVNSGQTVALHGLTLKDGNAGGSIGGGIANLGTLTVNHCTLTGNQAGLGGGIFNQGTLTVTQSTLSSNQADNGGGIFSATSSNFTTTSNRLTHCTVTGNTAASSIGGGIYNAQGRTTLTHCTVSGNTAPAGLGSGVASRGNALTDTVVVNSIIAANTNSSVDFVVDGTNSFTAQGRNLIGSGNATGDFTANNDLINNTPQLAPLGNYGGPTQTMALLPGSPARNVAAVLSPAITADQRGLPIIGTPDIGAYEAGTFNSYTTWIWESLPTAGNGTLTDPLHASTYDYDGDGQTNGSEWVALTNPSAATSRFAATPVRNGANLEITVPTAAGRSYTLLQSDNLVGGSWFAAPGFTPQAGTGSPITFQITISGTRMFHQVRVTLP